MIQAEPSWLSRQRGAGSFGLIAAALLSSLPGAAIGAPFTWSVVGGGSFNNAANWSPVIGAPPGTADSAIFNNNSTGTVTFDTDTDINILDFRNTSGALILDLDGNTVTLSNNNGIQLRNSATHVNNVTFTNGTIVTGVNTLRQGDAANMLNNVVTLTGANTLLLSNNPATGAAAVGNAAGADGHVLNILAGATMTTNNTFRLGFVEAPVRTNTINVTNANMNFTHANRPLLLQNGTLNVTNSTVTIASSIDAAGAGFKGVVNFNSGTMTVRQTLINNGLPFFIGDGGAIDADYRMGQGSAMITATNGVHVRSNGSLGGAGTITGNITGDAGARFGITTGAPTAPAPTTVNGHFDASNFDVITLRFGDFPAEMADIIAANEAVPAPVPPLVFVPPVDSIMVNGTYTQADSVVIDLSGYVPPEDMDYEIRLIGWTSESGADAPVSFINGANLEYEYRSDGLYVTAAVPEPGALGLLVAGLVCSGIGRRRRH